MIVLAIKTCFFNGVDSYNLGQKPHISCFFSPFCGKMIRVICAMLVVAIEDLELCMNNKNLPLGKSAIPFEPYTQKSEKGEYFVLFSLLWQLNIN